MPTMLLIPSVGASLLLILSPSAAENTGFTRNADPSEQAWFGDPSSYTLSGNFRNPGDLKLSPFDGDIQEGRNLGGFRDWLTGARDRLEPEPLPSPLCGCDICTEEVWNTQAGPFTCGELIIDQTGQVGYETHEQGCRYVATIVSPILCGNCDPDTCHLGPVQLPEIDPTTSPVSDPTAGPVLQPTSGPTPAPSTEPTPTVPVFPPVSEPTIAPVFAPVSEPTTVPVFPPVSEPTTVPVFPPVSEPTTVPVFPPVSEPTASPTEPTPRPVTPEPTSPIPTPETYSCGCAACTDRRLNALAPNNQTITCGERIEWAIVNDPKVGGSEEEACRLVAGREHRVECGPFCDPDLCHLCDETGCDKPNCGCWDCDEETLNTETDPDTSGFTCGSRINFLIGDMGLSEIDACVQVADVEFPDICGPKCNPRACDSRPQSIRAASVVEEEKPGPPCPEMPLTKDSNLYCFPPAEERTRWENVWGKYTVEAKEGICDPNGNNFTSSTVKVKNNKLKLQYKMIDGKWQAAEARILLPVDEMYSYGTYRFNIKRIKVTTGYDNTQTEILPSSIVLGMLTWDATTNCEGNVDLTRAVDIEISRWGDPYNLDAHFLVQPPHYPYFLRFNTGDITRSVKEPSAKNGVSEFGRPFMQDQQWYQFTWKPTEIVWETSAGGGRRFSYSTEEAIKMGFHDRVQCLPAPMEVRINLWNVYSAFNDPDDMDPEGIVTVTIDKFEYTPSNITGVPTGSACTKHCQCQGASQCVDLQCS